MNGLAVTATMEVLVRDTCGAYVTQTVRGRRASSTASAGAAAARLAAKLHGCEVPVELLEFGFSAGPKGGRWSLWQMPAPPEGLT